MRTREVLIVVYDGVQPLDMTGPMDVFTSAGRYVGDDVAAPYVVRTASIGGLPVHCAGGLVILPDLDLADLADLADIGETDVLLVPGGPGTRSPDSRLPAWLREHAPGIERVVSVCTGAFLLAEAGLLDGRRATTHWDSCAELARRYPEITVDPSPIFVRDGQISTSAGVTAGIDLAIALVEEDLGRTVALQVARLLVVFLRRPGNQPQFSAQLTAQVARTDPLREIQYWVVENLAGDLSVPALAERAGLSARQFSRSFKEEVGQSPGRYVDLIRLEAAQRMLVDTNDSVSRVAHVCGFGTEEAMRRAFVRELDVSPTQYRHTVSSGSRGNGS